MSRFCRDTGFRTPEEVTLHELPRWRDSVVTRSSTTTSNNCHRHLRAALHYYVELELMAENPILQLKPLTRYNTRRKACTKWTGRSGAGFSTRTRQTTSPRSFSTSP